MNSVTGSGFVAKCSNILQDSVTTQNEVDVISTKSVYSMIMVHSHDGSFMHKSSGKNCRVVRVARCQFHQYFTSSFFIQLFLRTFYVLTIWVCIFWQKDFGAKAAHKMMVKLTPGKKKSERLSLAEGGIWHHQ
jgi:hypothetical protein